MLEDHDNPVWSLGGNLLAPIYRGGALKTQVEIRTAEQKQAIAEYATVGTARVRRGGRRTGRRDRRARARADPRAGALRQPAGAQRGADPVQGGEHRPPLRRAAAAGAERHARRAHPGPGRAARAARESPPRARWQLRAAATATTDTGSRRHRNHRVRGEQQRGVSAFFRRRPATRRHRHRDNCQCSECRCCRRYGSCRSRSCAACPRRGRANRDSTDRSCRDRSRSDPSCMAADRRCPIGRPAAACPMAAGRCSTSRRCRTSARCRPASDRRCRPCRHRRCRRCRRHRAAAGAATRHRAALVGPDRARGRCPVWRLV